jgi:trehalose synthase
MTGIAVESMPTSAIRASGDRTVWHVNSTAQGGGVAELIRGVMAHHARTGLRTGWLVVSGPPEYFDITKQLHNLLHGSPGAGRPLGRREQACYARTTAAQARVTLDVVSPGDLVLLHDPQPLGMAPWLAAAGIHVGWRSHIGTERPSAYVQEGWSFLAEYLIAAQCCAFSSAHYVPALVEPDRAVVIQPSIDPESDKCRAMSRRQITSTLAQVGLVSSPEPVRTELGRIMQQELVPDSSQIVLQVSRWDRLKDMPGVLRAFATQVAPCSDAHLVLAGPDPDDIPDDLENADVFDEVVRELLQCPAQVRARVHLVLLSLRNRSANALLVNALQRRATVVVQKSLEEGFGLAVTEAMWKLRPLVASAVGGIREQIINEQHGLLIDDPRDGAAFGAAVRRLLDDPALGRRLAGAALERCRERFLIDREIADLTALYDRLLSDTPIDPATVAAPTTPPARR